MENLNLEQKIENLQYEISTLKNKEKNFNRKVLKFVKLTGAFGVFCGSLLAFAQVVASLHIFNDGEIISASKINENFAYLDNKISTVAAGGLVTESIPSHATINLNASDSGKLFSITSTAEFVLPPATELSAGYNFKISLTQGSQVILDNTGGANFDYYTYDLIVIGSSSNNSGGYVEILYTGSNWITPISTNTSTSEVNPNRIAAVNCNGKSAGATNCYNNPTATDTANFGFVFIDNYLFYYDGTVWFQQSSGSKYLLNDPNNYLPGVEYTKSWDLANSTIQQTGGVTYFVYPYSYNLSNVLNSETPLLNHAGVNNTNYINDSIIGNLQYSNTDGSIYYNGSNCQSFFGSNWRLPNSAEGGTIGNAPGVSFWTANATATAGQFEYIDAGGVSNLTVDYYMDYNYLLCVYQP